MLAGGAAREPRGGGLLRPEMKSLLSTLRGIRPGAARQILLAGLLWRAGAPAGRSAPPPTKDLDGSTLMQLALEHDEAERHRRADWVYDDEVVTVKVDAQNRPLDTRRESHSTVALGSPPGASGTLPAGGQSSKEPEPGGRFDVTVNLGRLANRFEMRREADSLSRDGRACYVVAFRPRAQAPPASGTKEERVVSQLAGHFWLAKEDLAIVQSEGELVQAVSVAWVASVERLRFRYQTLLAPGAGGTLPASFELEIGVSAPFYHAVQRQTTTMTHHRPLPGR